jgi:hypothetical protein
MTELMNLSVLCAQRILGNVRTWKKFQKSVCKRKKFIETFLYHRMVQDQDENHIHRRKISIQLL